MDLPSGNDGYTLAVELRYLYVGSADTSRDVKAWLRVPGSKVVWRFRHFGADVAAIDLGSSPLVVLADHRPVGSVLPIYAVADLQASVAELDGQGWHVEAADFGTPDGPAAMLRASDGSDTDIALLRVDRPDAMPASFADPNNAHAVRS